MRISLVAPFCAVGFTTSGGSGTLADDKVDLEKEVKKFQGTWTFESHESGGKELPAGELKGLILIFEGDKHTVKKGDEVIQGGMQKLDPSKSPKTIDVTTNEHTFQVSSVSAPLMSPCQDHFGICKPSGTSSAEWW